MSTMTGTAMTPELLKVALPKNLHGNATQQFADVINQLALAPETCDEVRSNFLTYSKVLADGKYKTEDYLNAVIYATHKFMGYSNKDAYALSFPDRYQALAAAGRSDKEISAYVSAYSKNKLVNLLLEQAMVPAHLLYQDAFHKAITTQIDLMQNSPSDKVRADAANSILTHLKAPEVKKIELDVNVKQNGGIDDLRATMEQLARTQLDLIEGGGATAGQMARSPLMLTQEQKDAAVDGACTHTLVEPIDAAVHVEPCVPPEITAAPATPPAPEPDVLEPNPAWLQQAIVNRPTPGAAVLGNPGVPPRRSIFDVDPEPAPAPKPRVSLFGDTP